MISKKIITSCFLFTLSAVYLVGAITLDISRDVPKKLVTSAPNVITVNLYDSDTATVPVATQDFDKSQGEWTADLNFSTYTSQVFDVVRFKVKFTNTGSLEKGELWYETLFDGTAYGGRTQLKSEAWSLYSESLSIGDSYGGGIIFWLDVSGKHGLIAATEDQSSGIPWYNGSYIVTGATLDGVYAGQENTNRIISTQGAGSYAAQVCADYSVTVNNEYYDDWYLPSKYELDLMFQKKAEAVIGGFAASGWYWSSSEWDINHSWFQNFNDGRQNPTYKSSTNYVRAVRAF